MKKTIAVFLSALAIISMTTLPVFAVDTKKTEVGAISEAFLVAPELEKKPIYDNRGSIASNLITDTVTIDEENGIFTVVTASGTQMCITVPFGSYCITQDVFQQLDVYMSLYNDVSAALKYYVSHGIHMDIFDFYTGNSTYVAESNDPLAALIGELNTLNDTRAKTIANFMSQNWYAGAEPALKTVGKNRYVVFDLSEEYGFVVYNHITNGKLIEVYTYTDNGAEGMKLMDSVLEGLVFSAVNPE